MTISPKPLFVLIDANALIHRSYHAIPPLSLADGTPTNAAYGFTMTLLSAIKELKPTHIAAAFDLPVPTFRHQAYQPYKAHRQKADDELIAQFPLTKDILHSLNIPIFEQPGLEADDIIGILSRQIATHHIPVIIVTGDMDSLQLIDRNTKVYTLKRGLKDTIIYNSKTVRERYGFDPPQVIDYKALRGDPSDNIPGVKGIGDKTATTLIQKYSSIDKLYNYLALHPDTTEIKPAIKQKLIEQKDMAYLSRQLATIVTDQPLPTFALEKCLVQDFDHQQAILLFQKLAFKSLIPRLPLSNQHSAATLFDTTSSPSAIPIAAPANTQYHTINTIQKLKKIIPQLQHGFTFDTETSSLDLFDQTQLVGISICCQPGQAYYLPLHHSSGHNLPLDPTVKLLQPIFGNPNIPKNGHHLKFDIQALKLEKIDTHGLHFDTMLASYLLNPNSSNTHSLDHLAIEYFQHQMIPITTLIGAKKSTQISFANTDVANATIYSCEDADFTHRLFLELQTKLASNQLHDIFQYIEMPLVTVLATIEQNGFLLDSDYFHQFNHQLTAQIQTIEQTIYQLADTTFNISSTQQLSNILFHRLQISPDSIKKTKTGLSTAASELEKISSAHPIIPHIQNFRLLTKLQNTYVNTLPKLVKPDGRIHASFNQTITATGRLSSSNPNLQNIPVKSEIGRQIRQGFIAPAHHQIVSIDYSQIELRLMAHIAQEPTMINAFLHNQDIHRSTAAIIYNKPLADVTDTERGHAKTINFSIIYGAGPRNIAHQLNISYQDARDFIAQYFQKFTHIKQYMDKAVKFAQTHGYSQTIYNRIRPIPDINSPNQPLRATAERMAINTPVQGSAADIMKLAMIKTHQTIVEQQLPAKIISQVHDELIFEIPQQFVDQSVIIISECMEDIAQLSVPLQVEAEAGPNWGQLTKIPIHRSHS